MRKPNVEIKRINLAKAELQLLAYNKQLGELQTKMAEVQERYQAKIVQVETLKNEIAAIESQTNTVA